jgi:rhamnose utilization protein RhaD (predicted bifunctional aldolase and dehydrogenase)
MGLAGDPLRVARATAGSLYPDHVIFLGPAAATPESAAAGHPGKLVIVGGAGLLLPEGANRSADELALCLALVLERVPPDAALARLTADEEAELLDWDAEKYRQQLAR